MIQFVIEFVIESVIQVAPARRNPFFNLCR